MSGKKSVFKLGVLFLGLAFASELKAYEPCEGSSCVPGSIRNRFNVSFKYRAFGADGFMSANKKGELTSSDDFQIDHKKAYGFDLRIFMMKNFVVKGGIQFEELSYTLNTNNNQNGIQKQYDYSANRKDIVAIVGVERHFTAADRLDVYVGPQLPIRIMGTPESNHESIREYDRRQGNIGIGLGTGLNVRFLKFMTAGIEFAPYYSVWNISTRGNAPRSDGFKFGNIGLDGNVSVGVRF